MNFPNQEFDAVTADAVSGLHQCELAAVETYTRAIGLFNDAAVIEQLQRIRDAHARAERELRDAVVRWHGVPATASGPWDVFAAAARAAKPIGCAALLAALRRGEEYAAGVYEDALNDADAHPDIDVRIGAEFLAASRRHINELNRSLGGAC